ncbi:DMT family transporter [Roseibacterium sp. SDUM158017]|uniref:DMT family transporter n=1 Tax=Roseicyclus salinarum TaxID=3036773 RepID=UPI002415589D|nr:DMT family transporter [Roseibacterium sp. SDUM158017]MDG4650301.1 DMT family transporter [Roseibacterium sp. SDUM158017]
MSPGPNLRGALLMTASMGAFTLNDVFVKLLAQDVPLFQIVFLRGVLTTFLLTLLAASLGQLRFSIPRADRAKVAWRTIFEIGAMVAFLTALVNMPIANATAILSALPLAVTVAAAVFLGEPLGWRRLSAVLAGFAGVMLIVQPGTEGFNAYALFALLAVLIITGRDLVTRRFSSGLPSMTVAVVTAASVGLFGGVLSLFEPWAPVGLREAGLIALASVFIIGGYLFSIMVMRVGEIAFTAPFRYTSLVFALVFGFVFFAEWPNALALSGAAIVVAMGVYTILRERVVAARARRAAAAAVRQGAEGV